VVAIDNDEWAFNNSIDNISLNATGNISVELGDAINIGDRKFDVILANINRNILLADIPAYANALNKDGVLIMSGFYTEDLPIIIEKAAANLLDYKQHTSRNNWVAAVFKA
ncbi:MAG: 50S ribosomal protein L11 methyltransferase, partial [Ignavibacteria bacterium]|nr:50S ribosomal protein L11 methyltransferase [Ignavibacteria bacterium]